MSEKLVVGLEHLIGEVTTRYTGLSCLISIIQDLNDRVQQLEKAQPIKTFTTPRRGNSLEWHSQNLSRQLLLLQAATNSRQLAEVEEKNARRRYQAAEDEYTRARGEDHK